MRIPHLKITIYELMPVLSVVVWVIALFAWSRSDLLPPTLAGLNLPLLIAIIGLVPVCAWALFRIPRWQAGSLSSAVAETDRFTAENEARRTLATILAGVALLGGSYSAMVTLLEQREDRLAARYVSTVQNLGTVTGDARPLRVGAVYALERIARTSPEDYDAIMELLASFIRERGVRTANDGNPPEDIRAALVVLARRRIEREYPIVHKLQLANTNLRTLDLRGAHLEFADLSHADLSGSDLSGAHLCGADLSDTELRGARLRDADLRLTALNAVPAGSDINTILLDGAVLYGPMWTIATRRDLGELKLGGTAVNVSSTFDTVAAKLGASPLLNAPAVDTWLQSVHKRFPKSRWGFPCFAEGSASVSAVQEFARFYGSRP